MTAMIAFVCVASDHCTVTRDRVDQNVTIHEGKWAVCPAGLRDGHVWEATSGLDYDPLFGRRVVEKRA